MTVEPVCALVPGFVVLLGCPAEASFLKLSVELRVQLKLFLLDKLAAQRMLEFS